LPAYLALLFWLVRLRGVEGAAIAWTARAAVDTVVLFVIARRYISNRNCIDHFSVWATAFSVTPCAGMMLPAGEGTRSSLNLIVLIVFAAAAWIRFLSFEEKGILLNAFRRPGKVARGSTTSKATAK
jgi:uncharacterized membrane protein YoaK (UPF0700 family)